MQRLKEQEFHQIYLWVLKENKRAIQFYEKAGFVNDGTTVEVSMDDKTLTDIRYRTVLL
jgi:RimJ/RimL family protein N-acetyltransferase